MTRRTAPTLALIGLALALAACGKSEPDERIAPEAASSEFVAPNPTEPAVPVTLPDTPMTNVPPSPTPPAAK